MKDSGKVHNVIRRTEKLVTPGEPVASRRW